MNTNNPLKWDRNRMVFFQIGIIVSLILLLGIFQIQTKRVKYENPGISWEDPVIINIPRTQQKTRSSPVPIPPKPKVITPNKIIIPVNQLPINVDNTKEIETPENINLTSSGSALVNNPPIIVPAEDPADDVPVRFADRMPVFGECALEDDTFEKCSEQSLLQYLYENLKYPAIARENGVEGQVVLSFVVRKDGRVTDIEILRDIGGGCGEAAKKVMKNMPLWQPGKQNGRPVSVYFTLPVRFTLEG